MQGVGEVSYGRGERDVGLLITVAGCGDDGPYAHLARRAEEVRELEFLEEVPTETFTPEEFREQVSDDVDERSDAALRAYADSYGRLGFFDVNLDLRPILTQSRVNATAAYYSPADERITFVGDPEDSTVIHEYVHALQDQHHDLTRYDALDSSSDGFLARRAVVEGDAMLAETRFRARGLAVPLSTSAWAWAACFRGDHRHGTRYARRCNHSTILRT